jgi:MoxR-like ATPase
LAEPAVAPAPADLVAAIAANLARVLHAPKETLRLVVLCLVAEGHLIIEDFPGVGKTMLAKALARSLDCSFSRLQFTPDLLPSDVTGVDVFNQRSNEFEFRPGPVFANLLLVDEVNRASPKTQAALLECMQESQVTVDGVTYPLERPFMVIATQNPIEYEGTYPLPEAQLDRFLFKLVVGYPSAEDERAVLAMHDRGLDPHDLSAVRPVASGADLDAARREIGAVTVDPAVQGYIVALVRATRESPSLRLGVSPRGATMVLHASKAWAWMSGRPFVTPDEVKAVAKPALRHRVQVRPEIELEGVTADGVLDGILATVPVPR